MQSCVDAAHSCASSPEPDDLAHQAAADALLAITGKLGQFPGREPVHHVGVQVRDLRGLSEVGPRFWQHPTVPMEAEDWEAAGPAGDGPSRARPMAG